MKIPRRFSQNRLALFLLIAASLLFGPACTKKAPEKVLNLVMFENPKSLDPILSQDALAAEAIGSVYETLYEYHYLKRPYVLVPLLADGMPQFSKDGLTVTIKIKKGVRFQDDACFNGGKGRELVAQDFIYAFKRLADPANKAEGWWIFDGKIKGFNAWRDAAAKSGHADYDAAIEGLQTPDAHTLVIKLTKKYPQLIDVLAMSYTAPMPREAIEKYGPDIVSHAVGTGPYVITDYTRGSQIVYEKNPNFHGENFPLDEGFSKNPEYAGFDYGKPLPLTDKIVVHIMMEQQPGWLQFMKGRLDIMTIPKDSFASAVGPNHELKPEIAAKGIHLSKNPSTTEWFLCFNMDDPVVGKNKLLRKAIGLAYDSEKDIELFTNGRGIPANQILPPSIAGFDPKIPPREVSVQKAKDLLAKAGNPDGIGVPRLTFDVEASSRERQLGEYFKSQMAQIGLNVDVRPHTRPELFELEKTGKAQIVMGGWIADYPDAENFMQLLYGPNRPPGPNQAAFNNPEYNKLYDKMAVMTPGPERQKIIDRMTAIMLEESPWIPNWIATLYILNQGWVKNYVYSDFSYNDYKYYRVDFDEKALMMKRF